MKDINKPIAIIGLGYVGLPLAIAFGKKYKTIGFDINKQRIEELKQLNDRTLEASKEEILDASFLKFTSDKEDIKNCGIYIVTVPTPIDKNKEPNLIFIKNSFI